VKPPPILSGWALPCTVFCAAVSWLYAPFWYVAFQLLMGMTPERDAPTPERARAAGVVHMATMSFMAMSLSHSWSWAVWIVVPAVLASQGVVYWGRKRA
jgi:hypothetical protein